MGGAGGKLSPSLSFCFNVFLNAPLPRPPPKGEKKSNFEDTVRVPLLIHVPWKPASQGKTTMAIAELVDVFPTVAALAGLSPAPGIEGSDLSSLLDNPNLPGKSVRAHGTRDDIVRIQLDT